MFRIVLNNVLMNWKNWKFRENSADPSPVKVMKRSTGPSFQQCEQLSCTQRRKIVSQIVFFEKMNIIYVHCQNKTSSITVSVITYEVTRQLPVLPCFPCSHRKGKYSKRFRKIIKMQNRNWKVHIPWIFLRFVLFENLFVRLLLFFC